MTATDAPAHRGTAELRAALGDLRTMGESPRVRLALAEAEFRLAVAAGTTAEEGIDLLRAAVRHDPYLVKGYLHLGRRLHRSGRHRAAVPEYLAALKLAPASRRIHLLLAEALLELDKAEQQAGEELITALADRPERLREVVASIEGLLTADEEDEEPAEPAAAKKPAARRRGGKAPADLTGVWQVWLLAQLGRSGKRAQAVACLKAGAAQLDSPAGPAEFVIGCLLLLLAGDPPDEVRKVVAAAGFDPDAADDPARRALGAALELAGTTEPVTFVRAAAACLTERTLPLEVVCWLHFTRFGPSADRPVTDALRLLDAYPAWVQADDLFRELRLAVLDGYARQAWLDGSLVRARLLWRETIGLDPYRVPVAVNLALLAARMSAAEEYELAWERLFELMYLLAAGVGDVQLLLAERRDLHLALTRQSWQRHCGETPPSGTPSEAQLDSWVGDPDALTVWLRDWDGYYVNARLSFRSPVHILGVARDVSPAGLAAARDAFVAQVDAAVTARGWSGGAVFRELAVAAAGAAFTAAVEPVERARDQYHEMEKKQADALAAELVQRTLVLLALIRALGRADPLTVREGLAGAVIGHQRVLPPAILQGLFVDKGLVEHDLAVAEVVENTVVRLADGWSRTEPTTDTGWTKLTARLDELVRALPHRLELRLFHVRALYAAKWPHEAYRAAAAALDRPHGDDEEAGHLREALADVIDRIGLDEIPAALRQPTDVATAERTVGAATTLLQRYPAARVVRSLLAQVLLSLGGEARQRRAAGLLVDGIVGAPVDYQATELTEVLGKVPRAIAADAVRAVAGKPGRAVGRVARCRALAQRYRLAAEVAALDEILRTEQGSR